MLTIVAFCVIVIVGLQIVLNTSVRDKIVHKLLAEYVDYDIDYSRLHISLVKSMPLIIIDVEDVRVDSLATIDAAHLSLNWRDYLKHKTVHLPEVHLTAPKLNLALSPSEEDSDTTSFSLYELPHVLLDEFLIDGGAEVKYSGIPEDFAITVGFDRALLRAELEDSIIDADLALDSLHTMYIADVLMSATAECKGLLDMDKGIWPEINLHIPALAAAMNGAQADLSANAFDLMGDDPAFDGSLCFRAELEKLISYLPENMDIKAYGDIDLDVDAAFKLSQLNMTDINKAKIDAELVSPKIMVSMPSDTIDASIVGVKLNLRNMQSMIDNGRENVVGLRARCDSMDVDLWESFCVVGHKVDLLAQDGDLNSMSLDDLPPVIAKVKADLLHVKGSDSLEVDIRNTENTFHITREQVEKQRIPHVSLSSAAGFIVLRQADNRVALTDAQVNANAVKYAHRAKGDRKRNPGTLRVHVDSLGVPDFMAEADFRKSDIDFRLDSLLASYFRTWNPSGSLRVKEGLAYTPMYPLRNKLNAFGMHFTPDEIVVDSLALVSGTSDVSLSGRVKGLRRGLTTGGGTYQVKLDLNSGRINANEVMSALELGQFYFTDSFLDEVDDETYIENSSIDSLDVVTAAPMVDYSLIVVPANVNADASINVGQINYSDFNIDGLGGKLAMQERCLRLTDVGASMADVGSMTLDAFYSTRTKKDISAGFNLGLQNVSADNVIALFPVIDEVMPMLKSFSGKLNCEMAATSQLDTNMNFILPSIDGVVRIKGSDLLVKDITPLKKITRLLMFKDKEKAVIDDMEVSGIISDNQLEVFPFLMSVDRYRMALQGTQNFDQSFKYHVSVIDSPIPFRFGVNVFGKSFENWKFRLARAKYKSEKIPLFDDEVDAVKLNLVTSIRNIFRRGANFVLNENRTAGKALGVAYRQKDEDTDDLLSPDESNQLDTVLAEMESEEEIQQAQSELESELAEIEIVIPE